MALGLALTRESSVGFLHPLTSAGTVMPWSMRACACWALVAWPTKISFAWSGVAPVLTMVLATPAHGSATFGLSSGSHGAKAAPKTTRKIQITENQKPNPSFLRFFLTAAVPRRRAPR